MPQPFASGSASKAQNYDYAIKDKRVLLETEYDENNYGRSYQEYVKDFHEQRMNTVFLQHQDHHWFKERYLLAQKDEFASSFKSTMFIVIRKYTRYNFTKELANEFRKDPNVQETYIAQKGILYRFCRDIYLGLKDGADPESSRRHYSSLYDNVEVLDATAFKNANAPSVDEEKARALFEEFCTIEKRNANDVISSYKEKCQSLAAGEHISFSEILREVFGYCVHCSSVYQSKIEMLDCCTQNSKHSLDTRENDVLLVPKKFEDLRFEGEDYEFERLSIKTSKSNVQCAECQKVFKDFDFFKNHYISKHPDLADKNLAGKRHFEKFIENLDIFILKVVYGANDKKPVFFANRYTEKHKETVYNFPKLFSGAITK
ncbi:hypothetical protein ENBRE01_0847 [Enteropsectra breve]|nr:hypothetical protein ENBRE01_0847 [Enteropsectra breve]